MRKEGPFHRATRWAATLPRRALAVRSTPDTGTRKFSVAACVCVRRHRTQAAELERHTRGTTFEKREGGEGVRVWIGSAEASTASWR
jgi:hypothetical protein